MVLSANAVEVQNNAAWQTKRQDLFGEVVSPSNHGIGRFNFIM